MTRKKQIRTVKLKYKDISPVLNERSRRYWAATEARSLGRGGITIVARATCLAHNTIRAGLAELARPIHAAPRERIRREGAGRKKLTEKDPELADALDALVEPTERGDPECALRWTTAGTTSLAETLTKGGHAASQRTVYRLLVSQDYGLQANRKTEEGADHPDRDAQFRFINESVKRMQRKNQPVVSVDTKKKENLGNFKNNGEEWRKIGDPRKVNMHDFADPALGKIIPHGVYDLSRNEGWITVGIDHDTASFAVASISR